MQTHGGEGVCQRPVGKEKGPLFKICHKKQYNFSDQVQCAVIVALELPAPVVEKAQTVLKEHKKFIDARQKNIKIADISGHGAGV